MVELEILESGNQKSIYVTEYVQFIFGVSYLFFNKFHMTQKEVADLMGISQSYISRLEKKIMGRLKKEIVRLE